MKKMLMFVASVATAIALTGCGGSKDKSGDAEKESASVGSSKGVAERFVNALIKKDVDAAFSLCNAFDVDRSTPRMRSKADDRKLKEELEGLARQINDDKLEGKAVREVIRGGTGYRIVNGKKCTDHASVVVQYVQENVKHSRGLEVKLVLVDGSWKVTDYKEVSGLDTSNDDDERTMAAPSEPDVPKAARKTAKSEAAAAVSKAEETGDYGNGRMKKFEGLCRELVGLARQAGEKVSESDVQEKIDDFKKLSAQEQDRMLKQLESTLEVARQAVKAKK